MKKLLRTFAFIFAALLALSFIPMELAFASEEGGAGWREDVRRVNDFSNVLADADALNEQACRLVEELEFDFVVITYTDEILGDDECFEYIEYVYRKNGMGYGKDHDGIVLAVNTDSQALLMESFGRGTDILGDNKLGETSVSVRRGYAEYGYDGAVDAFLEAASETVRSSAIRYGEGSPYYPEDLAVYYGTESIAAPTMPDWYPSDVNSWTWSPVPAGTPRVVDYADILKPGEEEALEAQIAEIAPSYSADIVIFTDVSTHGLSRAVYAADFYDFSGYGYGPEHDGFCLFICMDPNSRGGWCCVTGSEPRRLYTEENANALDDVLYAYLGAGDYYTGISDWVNNIRTLLDKGIPFAPEWYPSMHDKFVRENDPNAARVTDATGAFTPEQIEALTQKAKKISEKYGLDVVVHAADRRTMLGDQEYTDAFYRCKGYGFGENFDGIMLSLFNNGFMHVEGKAAEKLTEKNLQRLKEGVDDAFVTGDYYKAANRWLDYLDKTLKTGRPPRTPTVWGIRSAIAGVISIISSSANMAGAKRSMNTVRTAYEASDHLVNGSLRIGNSADTFTHNTVSRVYSPVTHESSGKTGGGGGSSYSGGYSGSSGSSHSGSGRDF